MAVDQEARDLINSILAEFATRPDGGTWGVPADYSIVTRQDQPPASGSSQFKVEDVPVVEQRLVGRITAGEIAALDAAQVRTLLNVADGANVVAAAVVADNAVVRGDGGARGVQDSTVTVADNGVLSVPGIGDGGLTNYDLNVGDTTTPDYGMIRIGNAVIGRTSYKVGNIDLDGTILVRNIGGPVTSEIEVIFTESTGNTCRFALPKSGVGNATYNPRSMLIAGPAPADTDFVKVSYWQTQGIFHNLVCDTSGVGADLGVQNDLEVEGDIFVDSILESTTDAGVTIDGVLIKDGAVDGVDISAHVALVVDPHSSAMKVSVALETPLVISNAGGLLELDARNVSADSTVRVKNAIGGGLKASLDVEKNITLGGTVDGRDVAADGALLDTALQDVVDDTTPQLGGQLDVNGQALGDGTLELLKFSETGSAVNELTVKNAVTTAAPELQATGDDANISLNLVPKGTGVVQVGGVEVVSLTGTHTLTNKTLTTPTIGDFTNAAHDHQDAAGGGTLDAAAIAAGTLSDDRIAAKYRKWGDVFFFGTADDPVSGGKRYPMGMVPSASTLKFCRYQVTGTSTPTAVFTIEKHVEDDPFTTRNAAWTANKTAAATTASTTSFDGPNVLARETLWLYVDSVGGSPVTLLVTLEGEID